MNILIVDDDSIAQFIIKKNLLLGGIDSQIEVAENGREALRIMEERGSPLLLLLDLNMPVFNGFQLLEAMENKNITPETYIITSSTLDSDRNKCMIYPFVKGFFEKPFGIDEALAIKQRLHELSFVKRA